MWSCIESSLVLSEDEIFYTDFVCIVFHKIQMIAVLVDKMIRTQIVDCAAVANWIFSSELAHDFTR